MEPFKNIFRKESIEHIILQCEKVGLSLARKELNRVIPKLSSLELKQRVHLIKDSLKIILPKNPKPAFTIIKKMLAPLNSRQALGNTAEQTFHLNQEGLQGFLLWPFSEYVADVGIHDCELSLELLQEMTPRFTSEFAIRPFILKYDKRIYKILMEWTNHSNEHVRRLCTEGSRPRLPWGMKLTNAVENPLRGIKILEKLKYDDSLYVRKSVANHLNDISKDHPHVMMQVVGQWLELAPTKELKKIEWIVNHAGRSLIKQGHPAMLKLIGIKANSNIVIHESSLSKSHLNIGETLTINIALKNKEKREASFILDYRVEYFRPNGKFSSKIFKGRKNQIDSHASIVFKINIAFKHISTRKIFSGPHRVILLLNGNEAWAKTFNIS